MSKFFAYRQKKKLRYKYLLKFLDYRSLMVGVGILVEYFYGDGSPLFLRQCQMTSTPQNLIKNIIFMPQFLPGDVKMAPGDVKMAPGDVKL